MPAVFVPSLIRFVPIAGGARTTAAGLVGVALTLLVIAAGYTHVQVVVALNLVLWIFFFHLESAWEVWFNDEASGLDGDALRRFSYLLAFIFVWPILGTFNLMLPLEVLANGGSMLTVGILDMLLGIGMAVAGTFWLFFPAFGVPHSIAIFLLGCAFGSLRVILRSEAASNSTPQQVGAIVAHANAYSLLLLSAVLAGGRYFSGQIWPAPFALTLLLVLSFHRIHAVQGRRPIPSEVSE
ncbi:MULTISPECIES: hypothetical protein [unclassified Streptomyces]|uniref:hypothetical protein n=1 Tax=unclassified Streptomyces TaxID=2593676 RepID=UPI001F0E86F3|nr:MULTISPECIES: hypothetical protein [unclassified Streptomyces]